jgi:integrase
MKGSLDTVQPLYPPRGVPLLDELAALRAYLRDREADGSDFLFVSQKGGRLHRSQERDHPRDRAYPKGTAQRAFYSLPKNACRAISTSF